MNFIEWNKVLAAFFVSGITLFICWSAGQEIVKARPVENLVTPASQTGNKQTGNKTAGEQAIQQWLQHASAENGQHLARTFCSACHTFIKEGSNTIGPHLYGITGTHIASVAGYSYSPALLAKQKEVWDTAHLWQWLRSPQDFASGTKMAFPGMEDPKQLADIVAYLQTLTNPHAGKSP